MISALAIAIWFGGTARKAGRAWLIWAIASGASVVIVGFVITFLAEWLFGSFALYDFHFSFLYRIVSAVIVLFVGDRLLDGLPLEARDTPHDAILYSGETLRAYLEAYGILPQDVICSSCAEELELNDQERRSLTFDCPLCGESTDMSDGGSS